MADAPAAPPAEAPEPGFKAPAVGAAPNLGPQADEAYNSQVAKIEFQLNGPLAGDKNTFENNRSTYEYNRSLLPAKEHEETGIERFRAATGGWGNSGFQARATGRLQAKFLDTRTKMKMAYGMKQGEIERREQERIGKRNFELAGAGKEAERRFKNKEVKRPLEGLGPEPPVTVAGGGPPGSSVTAGPGSPQQPLKFGFGAAEAAERPLKFGFKEVEAKERREAAARKARKR